MIAAVLKKKTPAVCNQASQEPIYYLYLGQNSGTKGHRENRDNTHTLKKDEASLL